MSRVSLAQCLNYMVCKTACNLFLNNRKFSVKQILQPQTLPHTPPMFLWVTRGAASKPLLLLSSGRQPPQRQPPQESRQHFCLPAFPFLTGLCVFQWADFSSSLRKFDLVFSKKF